MQARGFVLVYLGFMALSIAIVALLEEFRLPLVPQISPTIPKNSKNASESIPDDLSASGAKVPNCSSARDKSVLILYVDNRPLPPLPSSDDKLENLTWNQIDDPNKFKIRMSLMVSSLYACKHGYDIVYVKMKNESKPCYHPTRGKRAKPWCKVVGMHFALSLGYKFVLYLDSDVLFVDLNKSVEQWMEINEDNSISPTTTGADIRSGNKIYHGLKLSNASIIAGSDWNPWVMKDIGSRVNTGVLILKNEPLTKEIIESWWNYEGEKEIKYDYDQNPFTVNVLDKYPNNVARMPYPTMNSPSGNWIRHFSGKRHDMMQKSFREILNAYDSKSSDSFQNSCKERCPLQFNFDSATIEIDGNDYVKQNLVS